MNGLDALDRALLEEMQIAFPLVPRPFAALGEGLKVDESEVLARVSHLEETGTGPSLTPAAWATTARWSPFTPPTTPWRR